MRVPVKMKWIIIAIYLVYHTDAGGTGQKPEKIPEYSAKEEMEDKKNWRRVIIAGKEHAVDMRAINPYKKVLSHGGM